MTEDAGHQVKETKKEKSVENELMNSLYATNSDKNTGVNG